MRNYLYILTSFLFLIGTSIVPVHAAGENIEEDNFPIWRCANSNAWAHHGGTTDTGNKATCTTFKNKSGKSFKIELRYQSNFRNSRGSYAILRFCNDNRGCTVEVTASNLIESDQSRSPGYCSNCTRIDRTEAKNIILYILRNRDAYWPYHRSSIFAKHGARRAGIDIAGRCKQAKNWKYGIYYNNTNPAIFFTSCKSNGGKTVWLHPTREGYLNVYVTPKNAPYTNAAGSKLGKKLAICQMNFVRNGANFGVWNSSLQIQREMSAKCAKNISS